MKQVRGRQVLAHLTFWVQGLPETLPQPVRTAFARAAPHVRALIDSPPVRRAAAAIETRLPDRLSERLRLALIALGLLEAFLVCYMILDVIAWLNAPPSVFGAPQGPGIVDLFFTIVVLPSLIIAVRWKHRQATIEDAQRAAERHLPDVERAFPLLYLRPDAPLHIAQAAYAAAMKKHHPDLHGGGDEVARELNWAIEKIRERARREGGG